MLNHSEDPSLNAILYHCVCSCCYGSVIFLTLLLTDHKYDLGSLSSVPILTTLVVLECAKSLLGSYVLNLPEECFSMRDGRIIKKQTVKSNIKEIFKCLIYCVITVFVFFFAFIVFGAEALTNHEETFMLSVLLVILTSFHASINLGSHFLLTISIGMRPCSSFAKMVYRNILGSFLGTWFGAFFIPLDWGRPWQKWPITCALGAICGFTVSNLFNIAIVLHLNSGRGRLGRKVL